MRSLLRILSVLVVTLNCNSHRSDIAEGDIYNSSDIHYHVHPAIDHIMKKFPVKQRLRLRHIDVQKDKIQIVRSDNTIGIYDSGSIH